MKYLLCSFSSSDVDEIFQVYVSFYKVENTNYYLKALFERDNNCCLKRTCAVCCETFCKDRELKKHNQHYQTGERQAENKPINILKRDIFIIYSINFDQHSDFYDSFNPERIMNEFLDMVDNRFAVNGHVEVQAAFSIINYQPP